MRKESERHVSSVIDFWIITIIILPTHDMIPGHDFMVLEKSDDNGKK